VSAAPQSDDEVVLAVLDGLAAGRDAHQLAPMVGEWHDARTGFPAAPLLELAADAFVACGATREDRLGLEGLAERLLPEWPARGNTARQKRRHGLRAAVLISAGVEAEDSSWWHVEDLWLHALHAVVVYVRAAADRRHIPVAVVCAELRSTRS
jgi:hypothetical protein